MNAQDATIALADAALPRIVFVLGKGGVGRSTVAAALGLRAAERGERVLVVEWAVADSIGPWFGAHSVGAGYTEVAPRLAVSNFALAEALRAYFVDHLRIGLVYRRVIRSRSVARMIDIAPGLAEMFFLGQLWWLTTLAEREAGLRFDRVIVDAPATGHGASLLDVPATLARMGAAGLLAVETRRVTDLMADPARVGAIVVALPEPLVIAETLELVARLARPPLALIVNRSARAFTIDDTSLAALVARVPAGERAWLAAIHDELVARIAGERELRGRIACPSLAIDELPGRAPLDVVRATARALGGAS